MTNITYLSIIDKLLGEYKYKVTEDGYTFAVEKKEGLYRFLCMDEFFSLAYSNVFQRNRLKCLV